MSENGTDLKDDEEYCVELSIPLKTLNQMDSIPGNTFTKSTSLPKRKLSKKILRRVFSSCDDESDPTDLVLPGLSPPPKHHLMVSPTDKNISPEQWFQRTSDSNVFIAIEDCLDEKYLLKIDVRFMQNLINADNFNGSLDFYGTVLSIEALKLLTQETMRGRIVHLNIGQCHFIEEDEVSFITLNSPNLNNDFGELLEKLLDMQAKSLESLNLASILVIPRFPEDGLPHLKSLSLPKTFVSKSDLEMIQEKCPNLTLLNLEYASRNLRDFGVISQMKNLTSIWLSGCKIGDKHMSMICNQFQNQLVDLRINDCTSFSVLELLNTLSNLKILYIGHQNCPRLSLEAIANFGKLEVLSLRNCIVKNYDLEALSIKCGALKKLEITDRLIDMETLCTILTNCTQLEALSLENAARPETAIVIGGYANAKLKYLNFRNCPQIEGPELESLAEERLSRLNAKHNAENLEFLTILHSAYKTLKLEPRLHEKFSKAHLTIINEENMCR